jgi:hypothetical protein
MSSSMESRVNIIDISDFDTENLDVILKKTHDGKSKYVALKYLGEYIDNVHITAKNIKIYHNRPMIDHRKFAPNRNRFSLRLLRGYTSEVLFDKFSEIRNHVENEFHKLSRDFNLNNIFKDYIVDNIAIDALDFIFDMVKNNAVNSSNSPEYSDVRTIVKIQNDQGKMVQIDEYYIEKNNIKYKLTDTWADKLREVLWKTIKHDYSISIVFKLTTFSFANKTFIIRPQLEYLHIFPQRKNKQMSIYMIDDPLSEKTHEIKKDDVSKKISNDEDND